MKRFALCLLLAVCLLGCSAQADTRTKCKDLTFSLPETYINLSEEAYAQDADFLWGKERLILKGLAEKKTALNGCTLEEYTTLVLQGNSLFCLPEITDTGYRFVYEAAVEETVYAYVTETFEGSENFWIVQCYCPAEDLDRYQQEINTIFDSIQITT